MQRCVTACKNEHEVPWGINRRRVVTINDGKPGERSISVACMHCSDAPCMAVCPVDCFYQTDPTAWSCTTRTSASAAATASTPARSARRSSRRRATSAPAARWTSAPSAPAARKTRQLAEPSSSKYGRNRLAEGKLPLCAEMCSTKALLAGDGDGVATSTASASSPVASARVPGAGARPRQPDVASHPQGHHRQRLHP
jgi:formate dehydrogenase iron-sulfur subunit